MDRKYGIAFIGAGNMAEAIVAGLINNKLYQPNEILVTNRSNQDRLSILTNTYGVDTTQNPADIAQAQVIVLAMKPKDVKNALEPIKQYISEDQLIISVLAGISTAAISTILGKSTPVVRSMPNTSAAIGLSATAICGGSYTTQSHLQTAEKLFKAIGTVSIVNEEQIHAVTGVSGSGPAYIYYLIEAMVEEANTLGMDEETAKDLIVQTIIGAGNMVKSSPKSPTTLRKEVMSPGGTTEAGLNVLEELGFQDAIKKCIRRATERSKELGTELEKLF